MTQDPSPTGRPGWLSWVRVSEIVGVLALIIAALGFWDNHTARRRAEQEEAAAQQRAAAGPPFVLVGVAEASGDRIALRPANGDQVIQGQVFHFPAAVRGGQVETTGAARIESGWFEGGLRKTAGKGGADQGDRRLPVAVVTTYLIEGDTRTDTALYDIGYRLEPRFLRPDHVVLEGLSLVRRNVAGDPAAAVERVYAARTGAARTGAARTGAARTGAKAP